MDFLSTILKDFLKISTLIEFLYMHAINEGYFFFFMWTHRDIFSNTKENIFSILGFQNDHLFFNVKINNWNMDLLWHKVIKLLWKPI